MRSSCCFTDSHTQSLLTASAYLLAANCSADTAFPILPLWRIRVSKLSRSFCCTAWEFRKKKKICQTLFACWKNKGAIELRQNLRKIMLLKHICVFPSVLNTTCFFLKANFITEQGETWWVSFVCHPQPDFTAWLETPRDWHKGKGIKWLLLKNHQILS